MGIISEQDKINASIITQLRNKNEQISPNWKLVLNYIPLLKSIINKTVKNLPNTIDRESIYTIGLLGLISASQSYNQQNYNGCFGAYAKIRIKGALLDELRKLDWLPRSIRSQIKRFKQKVSQCEQSLKRPLSDEEICNYLHVSKKELSKLKQLSKPFVFIPLDLTPDASKTQIEKNYALEEKIADTNQENGRNVCEKNEIKHLLKQHIKALPKMVQQILALHYNEGLCLSEIAVIFKLSESRICQIHAGTVTKLRQKLIKDLKR